MIYHRNNSEYNLAASSSIVNPFYPIKLYIRKIIYQKAIRLSCIKKQSCNIKDNDNSHQAKLKATVQQKKVRETIFIIKKRRERWITLVKIKN